MPPTTFRSPIGSTRPADPELRHDRDCEDVGELADLPAEARVGRNYRPAESDIAARDLERLACRRILVEAA